MCKRLVELMKGRLGVESVFGKGSDFWIELPLADGLKHAVATPEPMHVLTPVPARPEGRTLLHIDDNPANLELVAQLLAQRPEHKLLSASLGALGLDIARAHLPTVILLDINLPDISGTEVLKMLKSDNNTSHIPVIALTANALTKEIQSGLQAGFVRYVTKPIRVEEFFDSLDTALLFAQQDADSSGDPLIESKATI
jgi:CheY-like chemotaxis protein